jgi:hypothetical protein
MPVIRQPIACKYDRKSQVTSLWFETLQGRFLVEYYCLMGISWPEGEDDGFIILGGQNLEDHRILIFREFSFLTIDHWINPDSSLRQYGLVKFLTEAWTQFQCRPICWHQDDEVHRRYSMQVYKSDLIVPGPEFIRVLYTGQEVGDNIIEEMLNLERLQFDAKSRLYTDLVAHKSQNVDNPGTHALRCLLGGFAFNPLPERPKGPKLIEYNL